MADVFNTLNGVNVQDHVEKKNGLAYLSWVWAWAEVKKRYPDATMTVHKNADGWIYHTDGRTCWVEVGVKIDGAENVEYLPVMDFKNKSIPLNAVTSYDVNKAIQRAATKAIARHGLGLYIYAGEDLPESSADTEPTKRPARRPASDSDKIGITAAIELADELKEAKIDLSFVLRLYGVDKFENLTPVQRDHIRANKTVILEKQADRDKLKTEGKENKK